MGFLEHFAEVTRANLGGKGFFFVDVEIMVVGFLAAMMGDGFKLLAINDFFFDKAGAGGIRRDRGH